jgi:hypothetical protein
MPWTNEDYGSCHTYAEEVAARLRSLGIQATNWRAVVEIAPADAERLANLLEQRDQEARDATP